jgi:hypothetical protein
VLSTSLTLALGIALSGIEPPAGAIAIAFDPTSPVKGRDARVRITFDVRSATGDPLAAELLPVVVTSTGKLGPITSSGGVGRFEALWTPAGTPEPEVLGIVALVPRCPLCASPLAAGGARLPISSAIDLPGKSDPGVDTWVEIAGHTWGPVRADAYGKFVIPVVVPPGARWGSASSQSAIGNEQRTRIDLRVSEAPALLCALWPERVPADGATAAGLTCLAWSASGGPLDPHPIRGVSGRGQVVEDSSAGGIWLGRYLPPIGGTGVDPLAVEWGAAPSQRLSLPVGLATGEPATIEWKVEGEPLVPGSRARVTAAVRDRWGGLIGEPSATDGSMEQGVLRIRSELGDGTQSVPLAFSLPRGGAPALLSLHRERQGWLAVVRDVDGRPVEGVPLRFGSGAKGVTNRDGEARAPARGESETVEAAAGLRAVATAEAAAPPPARSIARVFRVALRPPETVDVAAVLDGKSIRWHVRSPSGEPLAGRVVTAASGTVELGPSEIEGDGGRCAVRGGQGTVTVIDVESGVAALLEVR